MRQVTISTWEHRPGIFSVEYWNVDDDGNQTKDFRGQSVEIPTEDIKNYLETGKLPNWLNAIHGIVSGKTPPTLG